MKMKGVSSREAAEERWREREEGGGKGKEGKRKGRERERKWKSKRAGQKCLARPFYFETNRQC